MSEPKKLLETALFSLLDGDAGITWSVYNTEAAGSTLDYVLMQAAGGDDAGYHAKKRWYVYAYQVVGVHRDRSTAHDMNVAIEAAMDTAQASLSVAGFAVVDVARTGPIDYSQVTEDGQFVHFMGGVYEIELEEV